MREGETVIACPTEELLDEISLKAFVIIENLFVGAYMEEHLRKWRVSVDLRYKQRKKFYIVDASLLECLRQAKQGIDEYYSAWNIEV